VLRVVGRILLWSGVALGVLILALAIWIGPTTWRMMFAPKVYETVAPELPVDLPRPAVLVFSKTSAFRHGPAIDAANAMFREMARERGWGLYLTESGAIFNPSQLARFDVVVWNNVTGEVLTADQKAAFQQYLAAGGGYLGIHGAGDGSAAKNWPWYMRELIGARFIGHIGWPGTAVASVHVSDPSHLIMQGLPSSWSHEEEWYSFDRSVRDKGFRVLATVDERTYRPRGLLFDDLRMGGDHPVVWSRCVGKGRALYSAFGHRPEAFAEPQHRLMLGNAITWAAQDATCERGL